MHPYVEHEKIAEKMHKEPLFKRKNNQKKNMQTYLEQRLDRTNIKTNTHG